MNLMYSFLYFLSIGLVYCQKKTNNYPSLPTLWDAKTIEPGAPGSGKGLESYKFVSVPSNDNPSAMWSNYTACQRLIYVPSNSNAKRYLLGCDSVNCCYEEQSGNQVEFQIPNVRYSNPNKKVDVYYQRINITNFGEIIEADEWSWEWNIQDKLKQKWKAYTNKCDDCVGGVELLQWSSSAMGSEWFPVQFKGYRGYNISSPEGKDFMNKFTIPEICQKNNLLKCPSGLHDKYFLRDQKDQPIKGVEGGRQSECDVAKYLRNAGFPSNTIGTMVCISKYESSWNCDATNKNVDGSTDYGLFEINSYYWCSGDPTSKYNECGTSCSSLMDCQKNANCAYRVYKEQGFSAWYGYQYHKSECDNYQAPVCLENEDIYEPVDKVDLTMYTGRWFQIYKNHFDMLFQGEGTCSVADYKLDNDKIQVLNSQLDKDGSVNEIEGSAYYKDEDTGGKLTLSLNGIPKPMPYWIIELGPIVNNEYEYSIISDDKRISLFVLARNVKTFYEKYDKKVQETLKNIGFNKNVNKPLVMSQEHCDYTLYGDLESYSKNSVDNLKSPSCGTCGTAYQTCCIGFAVDGYPCDCHLTEGGSGTSGSNCGDCGTAYAACCIGYAADGYPCECDVV